MVAKKKRSDVAEALEILGTEALGDVEEAIENLCYVNEHVLLRSKAGKNAAETLGVALQKVKIALNNENLAFHLKRSSLTDDQLSAWIDQCKSVKGRPLYPSPGSDGHNWASELERRAVAIAYELMEKYNKKISMSKESNFEKLAKALAGSGANFHHYCRAHYNERKFGLSDPQGKGRRPKAPR